MCVCEREREREREISEKKIDGGAKDILGILNL